MIDPLVAHKLSALIAWRGSVMDSRRDVDSLPSDADLVVIAQCPEISRSALTALDLERPSTVVSFSAGILGVLRPAERDHGVRRPIANSPYPGPPARMAGRHHRLGSRPQFAANRSRPCGDRPVRPTEAHGH